tara:strand:- start:424 stop:609 length:186 start_codon:yes stop_codon:yes gene_type:complete
MRVKTEIELLMEALKGMQQVENKIENNSDTWKLIRNGKWQEAGFTSEQEAEEFLNNPYNNL